MKRPTLIRWSTPTLLVAMTLLAGCSWFHRDKVEYYKKAGESRPLEVPPDLDTPSTSKELVVPGTGTPSAPARPAAAAVASAAPSPTTAAATPTAMPPSTIAVDGNELHVADSIDNTYTRVGLALERAQIGTISARDAAAHSYALQFSGSVDAAPAEPTEHHWYSRVLHPFGGDKAKAQTVTSALRVNVSEDSTGARVSVNGDANDKAAPAAVKRVIEVLRERLS